MTNQTLSCHKDGREALGITLQGLPLPISRRLVGKGKGEEMVYWQTGPRAGLSFIMRALNTDPAWRDGGVSEGTEREGPALPSEGHGSGEGGASKLT